MEFIIVSELDGLGLLHFIDIVHQVSLVVFSEVDLWFALVLHLL